MIDVDIDTSLYLCRKMTLFCLRNHGLLVKKSVCWMLLRSVDMEIGN